MAYLGPWARLGRGVGRFREFLAFRRPTTGPGPGPMGLCPWARAHEPGLMGLRPWACAHGPGPMGSAHGPGPMGRDPDPGQGPKSENAKCPNQLLTNKNKSGTFWIAQIDPSRQGVMNEASFILGDINVWPKNVEENRKRLQTTKNPIPLQSTAYFSFKRDNSSPSLVSL